LIPPERRGEGMGYFGVSGKLALAFGPALGLTIADEISVAVFFSICAFFGLTAFILASRVKYKETVAPDTQTKGARFAVVEETAVNPSILLFFITLTFGAITSFLPLCAEVKEVGGIQYYFITYAAFLMISRLFAGKIYDKRADLYV